MEGWKSNLGLMRNTIFGLSLNKIQSRIYRAKVLTSFLFLKKKSVDFLVWTGFTFICK